jgi:hypothetical protein
MNLQIDYLDWIYRHIGSWNNETVDSLKNQWIVGQTWIEKSDHFSRSQNRKSLCHQMKGERQPCKHYPATRKLSRLSRESNRKEQKIKRAKERKERDTGHFSLSVSPARTKEMSGVLVEMPDWT